MKIRINKARIRDYLENELELDSSVINKHESNNCQFLVDGFKETRSTVDADQVNIIINDYSFAIDTDNRTCEPIVITGVAHATYYITGYNIELDDELVPHEYADCYTDSECDLIFLIYMDTHYELSKPYLAIC